MTQKQALLKAAEGIHFGEDDFSCLAVRRAGKHSLEDLYAKLASPTKRRTIKSADVEHAVNASTWSMKARKFRVLLLLMMRAAWKDIS